MVSYREKVMGMFEGIAIGDVFGLPFESTRYDELHNEGRHTSYLLSRYSDDTQLTLAVALALMDGEIDINTHVVRHIEAWEEDTFGWGRTTRNSVEALANGVPYTKSSTGNGVGNGVPMKVGPLAAYLFRSRQQGMNVEAIYDFLVQLCVMTHKSDIALQSGAAHLLGLETCFKTQPGDPTFVTRFIDSVSVASMEFRGRAKERHENDLTARLRMLHDYEKYDSIEQIVEAFDGGTCYCYNSLPFAYTFFLRNPMSVDSLYDVGQAGGDTDSNAAMVGACLGALHGPTIFPKHLRFELPHREKIIGIATDFCNQFPLED